MLRPTIDNVRVFAEPNESAKVVVAVSKTDEIVYLGAENDGYVNVQGATGTGWVRKSLVAANVGSNEVASSTANIPDYFVGDWHGTVYTGPLHMGGQSVKATLSKGENVTSGCTGDLLFLQGNDEHLVYRWNTKTGPCAGNIILDFIKVSSDKLDVKYRFAGGASFNNGREMAGGPVARGK